MPISHAGSPQTTSTATRLGIADRIILDQVWAILPHLRHVTEYTRQLSMLSMYLGMMVLISGHLAQPAQLHL